MKIFIVFALFLNQVSYGLVVGPNDDVRKAISRLGPGEELILRGGIYNLSSAFRIELVGTETNPIIIRAMAGETPLFSMNTSEHNVIEVIDSRYLEIRGLRVTGGSHGIRLIDSDYITILGCEIFETGDVAISANAGGTYSGLRIVRNHIHHTNGTGEGMYLGCNFDDCRVENSLIEKNYVHHTNGADVEQGDGIELKEGSSGNIIRHNVIHDTKYPGILVYGTSGNGSANLIEGNVIWNTDDWSIQAAADVRIVNNVIVGAGVSFQRHQSSSPKDIEFVHNTVLATGSALNIRNVVGPITVANNALYSESSKAIRLISGDTRKVLLSANMGTGGLSGASSGFIETMGANSDLLEPNYLGPPINAYPKPSGALLAAADPRYVEPQDFNGISRNSDAEVGAYEHVSENNPGWMIHGSFKEIIGLSIPKPHSLEQ